MSDITNPRLLYLKGLLMLFAGLCAAAILVIEHPQLRFAALLAIAIWGFCRAYYFAFYVIEKYVDPTYRFAGLGSFVRYVVSRRSPRDR